MYEIICDGQLFYFILRNVLLKIWVWISNWHLIFHQPKDTWCFQFWVSHDDNNLPQMFCWSITRKSSAYRLQAEYWLRFSLHKKKLVSTWQNPASQKWIFNATYLFHFSNLISANFGSQRSFSILIIGLQLNCYAVIFFCLWHLFLTEFNIIQNSVVQKLVLYSFLEFVILSVMLCTKLWKCRYLLNESSIIKAQECTKAIKYMQPLTIFLLCKYTMLWIELKNSKSTIGI